MARKGKRAAKKSKTKKRAVKRGKTRTAKAKTKTKSRSRRKTVSSPSASSRNMQEPIPAQPAGRIGLRRPSNKPRAPGPKEPREISQAEPDARFGDARQPEANAREHPDGSIPPLERRPAYKNTDEGF